MVLRYSYIDSSAITSSQYTGFRLHISDSQWSLCQHEDHHMRLLSLAELDRRQQSELHDGILTAIVEYDMHYIYIHHMTCFLESWRTKMMAMMMMTMMDIELSVISSLIYDHLSWPSSLFIIDVELPTESKDQKGQPSWRRRRTYYCWLSMKTSYMSRRPGDDDEYRKGPAL